MCKLYRMSLPCISPGYKLIMKIGSVIIVLHAPSDKEVETVDEILAYAAKLRMSFFAPPYIKANMILAFLIYLTFCGVVCGYMIYRVAPTHGTKNPMVYLSICSLAGSVSVMAIKVS